MSRQGVEIAEILSNNLQTYFNQLQHTLNDNFVRVMKDSMQEVMVQLPPALVAATRGTDPRQASSKTTTIGQQLPVSRTKHTAEIYREPGGVQIESSDIIDDSDDDDQPPRLRRPTSRASKRSASVLSVKTKSNKKGIYMPTFDGTEWIAFRIKFDTFCERYKFTDVEKLQRLTLALEGKSCRVLQNAEPNSWTYGSLIKALEARYGHSKSYPNVQKELKVIQRRPGQSLQDLADEIMEVARRTPMDDKARGALTRWAFVGLSIMMAHLFTT